MAEIDTFNTPTGFDTSKKFTWIHSAAALGWRGYGGSKSTIRTVEFDKQLDKVSIWLEQWDHEQRCRIVEKLLNSSTFKQFQFIWTVIQPAMHRDFMYTAKKEFPAIEFVPISTHITRKLRDKQMYMRQNNYYRVSSAHLQNYDQVLAVNHVPTAPNTHKQGSDSTDDIEEKLDPHGEASMKQNTRTPKLPILKKGVNKSTADDSTMSETHLRFLRRNEFRNRPGISRSSQRHSKNKISGSLSHLTMGSVSNISKSCGPCSVLFDGVHGSADSLLQNAPPSVRFIEMPVRRHIQDQESPRVRESINLSSMSLSDPSLASQLSLRERKKRRAKTVGDVDKFKAVRLNKLLPHEAQNLITWYEEQWDDLQRNEFLHKFLLKLDPRQHYFISSFLAIKQYRDFIGLLPENIALKILGYLRPIDIVTSSRVNKQWYSYCNDDRLWARKCGEIELDVPVYAKPGHDPDWKQLYKDNMSLRLNWQHGNCDVIDCKGHKDRVLCVTFDQDRLVTGSGDKTIRIWSLKDGKCTQVLRGHSRGVWALCFFTNNLLLSASFDGTLKVWNIRENCCARTLLSHEGPVWCLVRRNNTVVSGSQDRTAKIWDISKCLLLHTLKAHTGAVFCADMDEEGKVVLTGGADRSVRQWDASTGKQLRIIWVSQTTSVMAISFSRGYFATSYGEVICLYRQNGKLIKTFVEHTRRIETLELKVSDPRKLQGTIVSGGKDGSIKYWDLTKEKSVQSYAAHQHPVNCIHCNETKIVSASWDNRVKVMDFNIPVGHDTDRS